MYFIHLLCRCSSFRVFLLASCLLIGDPYGTERSRKMSRHLVPNRCPRTLACGWPLPKDSVWPWQWLTNLRLPDWLTATVSKCAVHLVTSWMAKMARVGLICLFVFLLVRRVPLVFFFNCWGPGKWPYWTLRAYEWSKTGQRFCPMPSWYEHFKVFCWERKHKSAGVWPLLKQQKALWIC